MAFNPLTASAIRVLFSVVAVAGMMICTSPPSHAQQGGWEILKIEGRDYVPIDNIKKFYNFTKLTRSGNAVLLENAKVEMKLRVGSQECLMNNVKFVFTHPVTTQGGKVLISSLDVFKLIDPVLRPSFIEKAGDFRTVILDPGHGGKDPGATNPLGTEATYNLNLAKKTKALLQTKGFRVVMTRESDRYLSLQERVNAANAVQGNAIFISIHFNSGGRAARGIETFTLSPPGVAHYGRGLVAGDNVARTGNQHDSANIALATAVHGSVLHRLRNNNIFDRGIKRARYSVLTGVRHPAILFEGGFMSHPYEARLIHNERYQNELAQGIVDAVRRYQFAVGRGGSKARGS